MRSVCILAMVLIATTCNVWSQESVAEEFESRLESASSKNRSIVAKFNQTKSVPGIKSEVVQSGDFYYDNSGDMAMIYDNPKGDKVVMNGESFTIIIGDRRIESDASNPMMAQISYMMKASMSGDVGKLGRGWELSITHQDGEYQVVVTPVERRVKRYVSAMTMAFDDDTMTLNSLMIDESRGGGTRYEFTSKKLNGVIDQAVFIP